MVSSMIYHKQIDIMNINGWLRRLIWAHHPPIPKCSIYCVPNACNGIANLKI